MAPIVAAIFCPDSSKQCAYISAVIIVPAATGSKPKPSSRVIPAWAQAYQSLGLRLFLWERKGDPAKDWKKATGKSWNRPDAVEDLSRFDPARHNVGTITGHEV